MGLGGNALSQFGYLAFAVCCGHHNHNDFGCTVGYIDAPAVTKCDPLLLMAGTFLLLWLLLFGSLSAFADGYTWRYSSGSGGVFTLWSPDSPLQYTR